MNVTSSIGTKPGRAPRRPAGTRLWASIDVEWTKNYRIKNGNRPFNYSVVYLAIPDTDRPVDLADIPFTFTSVYLDAQDETAQLLVAADAEVRTAFRVADHVTGHQFTSDLAVLANAAEDVLPAVNAAWENWRSRREQPVDERQIIDTRYDTDHVVGCTSRRLVDVCADLGLDVTQPELRGTSMTAVHRAWLERGDPEMRERVTVLNLRHSLSTALVALYAAGRVCWDAPFNVNRLLANQLEDRFDWLNHPTFTNLL